MKNEWRYNYCVGCGYLLDRTMQCRKYQHPIMADDDACPDFIPRKPTRYCEGCKCMITANTEEELQNLMLKSGWKFGGTEAVCDECQSRGWNRQ